MERSVVAVKKAPAETPYIGSDSSPVPKVSVQESAKPLVLLLTEHAMTMAKITELTGLTEKHLADINYRVPLKVHNILWALGREHLDPAIGLKLIAKYPRNHMHIVGHLAMRSHTLRDAALTWKAHAALVCDADDIDVRDEGDAVAFCYQLLDPRFEDVSATEHYLSTAITYARSFTGLDCKVRQVHLRHDDPGYKETYEELFGGTVLFGAERNKLIFDANLMNAPLVTSDSYMKDVLASQVQAMSETHDADLVTKVSQIIVKQIHRGQDSTIEAVADHLGVSARTLSRMLQQKGASFRSLVDAARRDLTLHMLRQRKTMQQIAEFLNFSETAALSRAFVRWCGMSMMEYRQRNRKKD